jgi:Ca-activated chloride channel family protein
MRHGLSVCVLLLAGAGVAHGRGLLIPEDKALPPLAMVNHKVTISVQDQVAVTHVEQTFRNHTPRQLEATYLFPVPKGASVNKFTMWVDGKEVGGEMLPADKARQVYTEIVRRTQDPGLLEYMGNDLFRLRVFPVQPKVDQKVAISFTSIAPQDAGVIEYIYPLKTDGKATSTLEEFSVKASIKSQHPVQNVYSPTHAINLTRLGDKEVRVEFDRNQAMLDKDFQLFYTLGDREIGVTPLTYRPITSENGYFLLLISPQIEAAKANVVPRDVVMVLDTSGSMAGVKMEQGKKAIKYCLSHLNPQDRFGLMNFSTTVNRYRDNLVEAGADHVDHAKKWVDNLKPSGGTAINDALNAALEMRSKDEGRTFTIVFFTDGQPTIGETKPDAILRNVATRNDKNTRIFTFGVGDDVNAAMLDQLAEQTRAVSTYVRPAEDIEAKTSSLYSKITHPVLSNLKMTVSDNIRLEEVYPPQLPDLFHGGQVVVMGRFSGQGAAAIKLTGNVGKDTKEFAYDVTFPVKTGEERDFVEQLWARRKVGYLLDQVRVNGEKKELIDEVVALATKYGIATPYTSYLIVPDGAMPVVPPPGTPRMPLPAAGVGGPGGFGGGGLIPPGLAPHGPAKGEAPMKVREFAAQNQAKPGDLNKNRGAYEDKQLAKDLDDAKKSPASAAKPVAEALKEAQDRKRTLDEAETALRARRHSEVQTGRLGVDLAIFSNQLRSQERLTPNATRQAYGRNCLELGGVWIDEGYAAEMKTVTVKAQSDAYFRILERQPKMKDVFRMGNHLVWVTPSKVALVVDCNDGSEKLSDEEIDKLFLAAK